MDDAIIAYEKALELIPNYTAAWHDLAITFERKMAEEKDLSREWAQKALYAWRETYRLAPDDPQFTAEKVLEIGQRVRWFEKQLG